MGIAEDLPVIGSLLAPVGGLGLGADPVHKPGTSLPFCGRSVVRVKLPGGTPHDGCDPPARANEYMLLSFEPT